MPAILDLRIVDGHGSKMLFKRRLEFFLRALYVSSLDGLTYLNERYVVWLPSFLKTSMRASEGESVGGKKGKTKLNKTTEAGAW